MRISDWSSDVCSSDLSGFSRRTDRAVLQNAPPVHSCSARASALPDPGRGRSGPQSRMRRQELFPRRASPDSGVRCVRGQRTEEHTSELQSLMSNSYAVYCLKKKNKLIQKPQTDITY